MLRAGQGEIDWPLRLTAGESEGTVHDALQVYTGAQLVVPLDPLAYHRALIEGLLRPMNSATAGPSQPTLCGGGPTSGEKHGYLCAAHIDQATNGIGRPRDGMDHHDLRASRDHRIPVRHGHSRNLMWHGYWLRNRQLTCQALGVGFGDTGAP